MFYLNILYYLPVKPSGTGHLFVERFWLLIQSPYSLLVFSDFLFLQDSVLESCMIVGIYLFLLGYPVC